MYGKDIAIFPFALKPIEGCRSWEHGFFRVHLNTGMFGPGGYAHFPGGTAMLHEPAADHDCTFVLIFDGPFDLDLLESPQG